MDFSALAKVTGVNLKHNFIPHLLIALSIVFLTPMVCGISSLDAFQSAMPLERLLSLTGPVLLTPVFLPEQNENIRDVIRSKRTDYPAVCVIRVLYSTFFLAVIIACFVLCMGGCESEVTVRHFLGGFTTALFLGAFGLFCAGAGGNIVVGYMGSMMYYISNYALKDKLGHWFLFSMSLGSFDEKYWLLGSSVVLILLGLGLEKRNFT